MRDYLWFEISKIIEGKKSEFVLQKVVWVILIYPD